MNLKYQGNRVINLNENIQRVEIINMKTNFNSLKNSSFTFDSIFYKQIAETFQLSPDRNKKNTGFRFKCLFEKEYDNLNESHSKGINLLSN